MRTQRLAMTDPGELMVEAHVAAAIFAIAVAVVVLVLLLAWLNGEPKSRG